MRRVRFSVAMSLDGYIAGPDGESDWIVIDPDVDFGALMGAYDTVILGRRSYEARWRATPSTSRPDKETQAREAPGL
jgi:dihydrofolate reductase